ncbi:MAG: amidohydrolase [Chloroherpetonaceae bacterium]|nr:amidohydrolase [Chloroherpetonaceae bacterium]MCS7211528.1 amidohydrolase [Chloroherpetonaceae bacterium]MDW8019838.1 amidohydrolase [Chloroherpetonaceae bacterium]
MHKRCISILGATLMLALSAVQSIAQTVTYSAALSPLPPAEARQKLIEQKVLAIEPKVIAWRRDLHQNPELSNREFRTAKVVAEHLRSLGLEVKTGVAHTGVVAVLRGAKPGKVVALRADMDALPVTEETGLPFASKAKAIYNGQEVGVMHACGHDCHTAILMGVAEILAGMKDELRGTVKFIFQPAEEGAPEGEEGGAELMIKQGVLENPKPEAIFGLHVFAGLESGKIAFRPGPTMAAVDNLEITIKGRQTHGAKPWAGIDPIVVASQVILGLQTIASRQVDVTAEPSIITVGSIRGGIRYNIIPDSVHMLGTIRTFNEEMQNDIHERIRRTADMIAKSAGAHARVTIRKLYPTTHNDEALTAKMIPSLERAVGKENVVLSAKLTGSEDFSFYQKKIPGFFFFVGITPKQDLKTAASNHSPRFYVDESALKVGVKAMLQVALDYLELP